ncbi:MAG: sigma-70 family RNA polymerase sigma factor [Dehalococcoidia bacterium]
MVEFAHRRENSGATPGPTADQWPVDSHNRAGEKLDGAERVRQAIVLLYESAFERVHRYIALRIGFIHEAEDISSEVFLKALRSAGSYRDTGKPLEAWVFRIAHNLVVDHLRKQSRTGVNVPLDGAETLASVETVHERIERREDAEELHRALKGLTEPQRQVIALRFGAGMSSEEVADVLGKRSGAVRYLQHAAIEKLRKELGRAPAMAGSRVRER